jgi:archaellum component FlaC
VATKQVNIDIIAKDKTRQAMRSATGGVDKLKQSVFNLKNALIGIGAGVTLKSFVDVGRQVESLQIRLKFLFDSVEEGAKAFDVMSKFASKVPFSLEQIQAGAGNLAVVAKDSKELARILEITGNVASVTGLDFQTTAEQIQRSFSAGVASADIFRERGVRDLLGFKAGATVTAEETAEAFERVFGKGGRFAGATDDLANTLTGTLSMLGDKLFNFQKVVAEQFLIGLKQEFGALDKALEDNEETINKVARAIGKGLSDAVILAGKAVTFISDNFQIFKALGMALVVAKISSAFLGLARSLSLAGVGMLKLNRISKGTGLVAILALGVGALEATGKLEKLFKVFQKDKTLEDFKSDVEALTSQLATFTDNGADGFDAVRESYEKLRDELRGRITAFDNSFDKVTNPFESHKTFEATKQLRELEKVLFDLDTAYMNVPLETIEVGMDKVTKSTKKQGDAVKELTGVYENFEKGFMDAFSTQKDMFKEIQDIGKATFEGLKQSLTDFVMTGKLSFQDLSTFIVRKTVEMLIGQAIQSAFDKGMALFKADSIKKAMISLYEGAMKTFASIPFPFNIAVVGGALAFGAGIVNKIRGFERGGRPPVGQPSIVGEKGAELFVPDQAGTVVPNDKLGMNKNVTVNFNINTVDARGFNELLVNSRGVIINLINSAMNEKGRMAVI